MANLEYLSSPPQLLVTQQSLWVLAHTPSQAELWANVHQQTQLASLDGLGKTGCLVTLNHCDLILAQNFLQ